MSRTWKIALAVSLALNLFLVGAGVGVAVVGWRVLGERSDFRRGGQNQRMWQALQALPPERRQAMRDFLRSQALVAADDLQTARAARQEASQLMTADRYDAGAVAAALARARDADGRARARIDAALAARLSELTPGERAMFSRLLMRGPGRGGRSGPRSEAPAPTGR